jgi:hypothetical protein
MTQPNDEEAQVSTRERGWTRDMDREGVCVYFAGFSRVPCKSAAVVRYDGGWPFFTSAELDETEPDRGWIG